MKYEEKIVTHESLRSDVLCCWRMFGNNDFGSETQSRYLPKGQSLLVFNFGDRIEYFDNSDQTIQNQKFFVVPAKSSSSIIIQEGVIDLFGITLIGEGLYKLFKMPVNQLTGAVPNALNQKFSLLYNHLAEESFVSRAKIAEKFLLENLDQGQSVEAFQAALKVIHQHKGVVRIFDVASWVHLSERQLQRLFKTRLGISPKDYCKIIRVNHYIEFILDRHQSVDWFDIVVELNYHDQPHLIKEIKSLTKLSPRKLREIKDTLYHRITLG